MDPVSQYRPATSAAVQISRFMSRVYGWMTFGLLITAVVSFVLGSDVATMQTLMIHRSILWGAMIVEFLLVIGLSAGISRMSVGAATFCFLLFSFVNGITFSTIFLAYSIQSIGNVFAITAGSFMGLAMYGYVTKRDLTALGTFFVMALWGLILAMVVNMFLRSAALDFSLSAVSVLLFSGLTAYDVQKIKSYGAMNDYQSEASHKVAIVGALNLYLDFINLFLALLRLFGGDRRR